MESVLVWINSAPSSSNLRGAFELALNMRAQGRTVSIFLAQDAVLAGVGAQGETPVVHALQAGIATYALSEDLHLRGFAPATMQEGVQLADYTQLVDLLAQHERVIGAL
ncbi:MAG: DsrE family protein [Chloroflexi bacterium]|nr:DsrE family protein [Chloroflexota bacterium]